jgi:phospho-N-acetylmuramoyl-pentapeptide-transferase
MIYWLYENREWFAWDWMGGTESPIYKLLNLFKYHTFRAGGAALTALALSLLFGERVIRKLISLKVGQPIRSAEELNNLLNDHAKKAGTPTMGGVLIIGSWLVAVLMWAAWDNVMVWTTILATLGLGALGFMDDYQKVAKKNSKGVNARFKLVWQGTVGVLVGLLFAYGVNAMGETAVGASNMRELSLPFLKEPVLRDMGVFAVLFYIFIMQGTSNAVNVTDGLDGLAAGCTVATSLAYTAFTYLAGASLFANYLGVPFHPQAAELSIVCMALAGSCLGFLWWNAHPARMFMGDTGSMALGGCIAAIAIGCRQEFALVIVGGVFVMEALSVIIQVGSFKLRGKRVFRMAPIHHHFEIIGWKENQVIVRFWILSLICALLGLATLKLR